VTRGWLERASVVCKVDPAPAASATYNLSICHGSRFRRTTCTPPTRRASDQFVIWLQLVALGAPLRTWHLVHVAQQQSAALLAEPLLRLPQLVGKRPNRWLIWYVTQRFYRSVQAVHEAYALYSSFSLYANLHAAYPFRPSAKAHYLH
jgi:hypothetical protein